MQALPEGTWYCSTDCVRINQTLQALLNRGGEPVHTMDLDVIKKKREAKGLDVDVDLDVRWRILKDKSSEDSKLMLSKAVAIFHVSFCHFILDNNFLMTGAHCLSTLGRICNNL